LDYTGDAAAGAGAAGEGEAVRLRFGTQETREGGVIGGEEVTVGARSQGEALTATAGGAGQEGEGGGRKGEGEAAQGGKKGENGRRSKNTTGKNGGPGVTPDGVCEGQFVGEERKILLRDGAGQEAGEQQCQCALKVKHYRNLTVKIVGFAYP